MPNLTKDEISALQITKFIFHVVHHGDPAPILLDQVPIGQFQDFFVARVVDTLKGNRYSFMPESLTLKELSAIEVSPRKFVPASKTLAIQIHSRDLRVKRGVLIVMMLTSGTRKFFSLIKYDHEKVVSFTVDHAQAILQDVVNSFTESPKSLQKSALIELSGDTGELAVIDRNVRSGISTFFEDFLGVQRSRLESDLTADVVKAVLKTVQLHQAELPYEITARVSPRVRNIATKRGTFDADEFFADFFGAEGSAEIRATFDEQLDRRRLSGEAFRYDKSSLPEDAPQKFKTAEGITLVVPDLAKDTIKIEHTRDGFQTITIKTPRVIEQ